MENFEKEIDLYDTDDINLEEMAKVTQNKIDATIDKDKSLKENNFIKGIISKKKKRFEYEGFSLDLTYITENIIAMGFPAENMEKIYRNGMSQVKLFFEKRHPNRYKVYNLCSEKKRSYPENSFYAQTCFPFDDHEAPPINLIMPFCIDVDEWLSKDPKNVAAIHCKAGKGRTGTLICCYFIYKGFLKTADKALRFYGLMRTINGKGVTIPSQMRYVYYFAQIMKNNIPHPLGSPNALITKIKIYTVPYYKSSPYFTVENDTVIYDFKRHNRVNSYKNEACIEFKVNNFKVKGDCKFTFFNAKTFGDDTMFKFWINTYFISTDGMITIKKSMTDLCHKDKDNKLFDPNFKIDIHFII